MLVDDGVYVGVRVLVDVEVPVPLDVDVRVCVDVAVPDPVAEELDLVFPESHEVVHKPGLKPLHDSCVDF